MKGEASRLTHERTQLEERHWEPIPTGLGIANRACARALREEEAGIYKGPELICHVPVSSCLPRSLVHFQGQESLFTVFTHTASDSIVILITLVQFIVLRHKEPAV